MATTIPIPTKTIIRHDMLAERKALSAHFVQEKSDSIIQYLSALPLYQAAKNIGLYQAIHNEVNLNTLWQNAEHAGKKTFFPVINSDKNNKILRFLEAPFSQKNTLSCSRFGILEPPPQSLEISIDDLDCLLIPLVAFDKKGYRLGMGAGYYDQTLCHKKPFYCIGIAYAFQVIEQLPRDSWDIPLNIIITETGIQYF